MGELSYNSALITRYLLGDLTPAEQESLEEGFFIDHDLFIELLDTEDRLISDYLNNRLSATDRAHFERNFLTLPERRRDVELAYFLQPISKRRSSIEDLMPEPRRHNLWHATLTFLRANQTLAGITATAILTIVLTSVWLVMRSETEMARSRTDSTAIPSTSSTVLTFELSPGQQRGEDKVNQIILSPGVLTVALQLDVLTADYTNFRARLLRIAMEVTPILASDELKSQTTSAEGTLVLWEIPASKLQQGDYQVKLDAVNPDGSSENAGTYYFSVRTR
jgi:hypothetical protein